MFAVDTRALKLAVSDKAAALARVLLTVLLDAARTELHSLAGDYDDIAAQLSRKTASHEDWAWSMRYVEGLDETLAALGGRMAVLRERWSLLERFEFDVDDDDMGLFWRTQRRPRDLHERALERQVALVHERAMWVRRLGTQKTQLESLLGKIKGHAKVCMRARALCAVLGSTMRSVLRRGDWCRC